MSTTFSTADAPFHYVDNEFFDPEESDSFDNPRQVYVSTLPEVNIADTIARKLVKMLDLKIDEEFGFGGVVEIDELGDLMRKLIKFVNSSNNVAINDSKSTNWIEFGRTDQEMRDYVCRIMDVVVNCIELKKQFIFAG